jgi:hypothetical protein
MYRALSVFTVLALAVSAQATLRITEYQYAGDGYEWVEFTNLGTNPQDMAGWSYDDSSAVPGSFDLSPAGIIAPGESFIITEEAAGDFNDMWNLTGVTVLGGNTNNLGRADEINLFNGLTLIDRLTYDDQGSFPQGGPRANDVSINPPVYALGTNIHADWVASSFGDSFGSFTSDLGTFGNPGTYVPEPSALILLAAGALVAGSRTRRVAQCQ